MGEVEHGATGVENERVFTAEGGPADGGPRGFGPYVGVGRLGESSGGRSEIVEERVRDVAGDALGEVRGEHACAEGVGKAGAHVEGIVHAVAAGLIDVVTKAAFQVRLIADGDDGRSTEADPEVEASGEGDLHASSKLVAVTVVAHVDGVTVVVAGPPTDEIELFAEAGDGL